MCVHFCYEQPIIGISFHSLVRAHEIRDITLLFNLVKNIHHKIS